MTGAAATGVRAGAWLQVGFERTLRLPDDGKTYPLPPDLGALPMRRVADYAGLVPAAWRDGGGPDDVLLPLHEREALFLVFAGTPGRPCAVKVGVGGVDAVSGQPWNHRLQAAPQDYLVCPPQPWLDGINAGAGMVRQFVAVPLGRGQTVEAQLTGREVQGGIQILVWEARPGRFADPPVDPAAEQSFAAESCGLEGVAVPPGAVMGLGAGGRMHQRIYPDPYGIETWEPSPAASLRVYLLCARDWAALTGAEPPPTPVSAALYTAYGLPWFALADADRGDIAAAPPLARVKGVRQLEREAGAGGDAGLADDPSLDASLNLGDDQIITLGLRPRSGVPGATDDQTPEEPDP